MMPMTWHILLGIVGREQLHRVPFFFFFCVMKTEKKLQLRMSSVFGENKEPMTTYNIIMFWNIFMHKSFLVQIRTVLWNCSELKQSDITRRSLYFYEQWNIFVGQDLFWRLERKKNVITTTVCEWQDWRCWVLEKFIKSPRPMSKAIISTIFFLSV